MFIVGVVGEVYRGSLWGTDIAIKQLKKQQVDEDILTSLKHEVCVRSLIADPPIIPNVAASR